MRKTKHKHKRISLISQAQDAIESEKKAALAELTSQVANLSIDIAEKVVRGELSNKGITRRTCCIYVEGSKIKLKYEFC